MNIWENIIRTERRITINQYLYEIIEDYKYAASKQEQESVFRNFCTCIWSNGNKRRVYTRNISFSVQRDLLFTNRGQLFASWSKIPYTGYKPVSKENDWSSLIRQKINNLYSRYFDPEVILSKEYLSLLNTPKKLYYQWLNGSQMDLDELNGTIRHAMDEASRIKKDCQKQKMNLFWNDYKNVIEAFLRKIFDNCKLLENYETNASAPVLYDFISEDNFYIRYFCKSLENYMRNYHIEYYGIKRGRNKKYTSCKLCGRLIEKTNNRILYCGKCKIERNREKSRENMRRIRNV